MTTQSLTPYRGIDIAAEVWRADGVCAEVDPDLWFPDVSDTTRAAKRICAGCPVTDQCLEAALAGDERFGVWGGLTTTERDRLTGRRRTA